MPDVLNVKVQAASTLSDSDRGVIYANSRTDFRDESIYFTMTTRFYDGDPSNNTWCWDGGEKLNPNDPEWRGDFKGLIEKLDYIKALGFTAIWITPVVENCSGYDYHGYHAINHSKVDPRYESSDCTYQDLIDACHAKGMKIIQDIVLNHTGNFGETNLMPMFEKVGDLNTTDCLKQTGGMAVKEGEAEMEDPAVSLLVPTTLKAELSLYGNGQRLDQNVVQVPHAHIQQPLLILLRQAFRKAGRFQPVFPGGNPA